MTISTDFSLPTFLERGKTTTLTMPIYASNAGSTPTAPASGTFTLYNESKVVVVTGAVTITSSIATYAVLSTSLPATLNLSDAWQEEWVLTLLTGEVETIRRDAYLCLRSLYNVVNEPMLLRRVSDLNNLKPASMTSFQSYIDEGWSKVQTQLLQDGKRPFLIMNSWALKDVTLEYTLAYLFGDLDTYMGDGRYQAKAKEHMEAADESYGKLKLEYDLSQTNQRASADDSTAAVPVIYTNTPRWPMLGGSWGNY